MKTYSGSIQVLKSNEIFVFGSNTEGRHGAGSAKLAKDKFGAIYGQARGLQGNSYAIVTKDLTKKIHPSVKAIDIKWEILKMYLFAEDNPHLTFYVAYSGKGRNLNAYTSQEMANMFSAFKNIGGIPDNIVFEEEFAKLIKN